MKNCILVIDDSLEVQKLVCSILPQHRCLTAGSLAEAKILIKAESFDLILLDVNLPDGDGFQFFVQLPSITSTSRPAVIFLTVKSDISDKVLGLNLGAEDYITKPFDILEFKARVESKLKKRDLDASDSHQVRKEGLRIDLLTKKLFLENSRDQSSCELTPIELRLLSYFMNNQDHVLGREKLLETVWGSEVHVLDRAVDNQIKMLRKRLDGSHYQIRTVYGYGYVFEAVTAKQKHA